MILKDKLSLLGVIIAGTSLIIYLILHVFILREMGLFLFILGLVAIVCHQSATWWIFYRFAITRQRMKNRLQFMHQVALGVTLGFTMIFLLIHAFFPAQDLQENAPIWQSGLLVILIGLYIMYQENNTHNFISFNIHKKVNQSKKAINQYIGFGMNWLLINVLWNSLGFDDGLPVFALIYIFLMLVQNSLNYTTLGQSKYWNFTYEAVLLIHLYSLGMQKGWIWMIVLNGCLAMALFLRQWKWMNYKKYSRIIGVILLAFINAVLMYNIHVERYANRPISELIPITFIFYLIILAIVYIINEPTFYRRLSKQ